MEKKRKSHVSNSLKSHGEAACICKCQDLLLMGHFWAFLSFKPLYTHASAPILPQTDIWFEIYRDRKGERQKELMVSNFKAFIIPTKL